MRSLCLCVCVCVIKRKGVGIFMPKTAVFKNKVGGGGGVDPKQKAPIVRRPCEQSNCIYLN